MPSVDAVAEEQLLQDYKHIYWTRLMVIGAQPHAEERKWPLGPDIVEECQAVAALPLEEENDHWAPLFEPTKFNAEHGPLKLEDYRLSADELKEWAERAVVIRASIAEKAKNFGDGKNFDDSEQSLAINSALANTRPRQK